MKIPITQKELFNLIDHFNWDYGDVFFWEIIRDSKTDRGIVLLLY